MDIYYRKNTKTANYYKKALAASFGYDTLNRFTSDKNGNIDHEKNGNIDNENP